MEGQPQAAARWGRRWWTVYILWIALCAVLFFALRGKEDPSRRGGRILNNDAAAIAMQLLRARDLRYRSYDVVHVAYAGKGEGGAEARWVVLCDRAARSGLKDAVVVELRASDGALLTIRKPVAATK